MIQICSKKYWEVFQQLYQYAFAVSRDKNTVKTARKNRVFQESDVRILPKIYEPDQPSVITQVIMSVFQLNTINILTKKIDLNFANFYYQKII